MSLEFVNHDQERSDSSHLYIRDTNGQTFHVEKMEKALEHFFSDEGYRLSIRVDGYTFVMRKNVPVDDQLLLLDKALDQRSVNCAVTVRST